jgi:hypothetical protein
MRSINLLFASRIVEASTDHTGAAPGNLDGTSSRMAGGVRKKYRLPSFFCASQKVNATRIFNQTTTLPGAPERRTWAWLNGTSGLVPNRFNAHDMD